MKKIICNFFRSFIIINKCIWTKDKNKTDKIEIMAQIFLKYLEFCKTIKRFSKLFVQYLQNWSTNY